MLWVASPACPRSITEETTTQQDSAARHDTPPNRRPWSSVCSPPVRSDSPSSDARGSSISLPFLVPCGPAWLADRWWNSVSLSAIVDRGVILVPPCRRWFRLLVVILAHRIDWPEAFVRRPSFRQCSIHREVFVTEQLPGPCFSQNPLKERFGDVSFQHALPVLGKRP